MLFYCRESCLAVKELLCFDQWLLVLNNGDVTYSLPDCEQLPSKNNPNTTCVDSQLFVPRPEEITSKYIFPQLSQDIYPSPDCVRIITPPPVTNLTWDNSDTFLYVYSSSDHNDTFLWKVKLKLVNKISKNCKLKFLHTYVKNVWNLLLWRCR